MERCNASYSFFAVYVRTDVPVLMERIRRRGRPEEKDLPVAFVEDIQRRHERWLMGGSAAVGTIGEAIAQPPAPVLVLDGNLELEDFKEELRRRKDEILGGMVRE